jgi:hypothetical protein
MVSSLNDGMKGRPGPVKIVVSKTQRKDASKNSQLG